MGNIVKLVFQAIATGSGFGKLLGEVKGLNEKMPGLSKAAQIVGASFGTAGAAAGRMVTMLLQGGVWGVAAEGAKLLIDQLGLFKDKTAETKEKLDKLEESTRKFYETINANSQKSLEKIDKETKRRNEQLDITNRMIKAELQLQKARALASGDTRQVESVDRQIANADRTAEMDKAVVTERGAGSRVKDAEAGLAAAQKAERAANAELAKAEAALASASKPVNQIMQSSAGAFVYTQTRDTTVERAAVDAARKRVEMAERATDEARRSVEAEREKWNQAKKGVEALKAEQAAADAEAAARKWAEAREKASADAKALKDARAAADEEIRKHDEEIAKKERERRNRELQDDVNRRNERRKMDLQKDIEANRKRAASLEQALGAAMDRVRETHDVLGNAANMDQAGGVSKKRREWMNDIRYANGAVDLISSGKIKRGEDGTWRNVSGGRLSNLNQAILDRLNAEQDKQKLEKENDKVVEKLDELIKKLEQMSTL